MRRFLPLWLLLLVLAIVAPALAQPIEQSKIDGCAVTTASALCTDKPWSKNLTVENTSATAIIACAFGSGATATLNGSASFMVYPGRLKIWTYLRGSAPPSGPLYCIASVAGSLRIEYF